VEDLLDVDTVFVTHDHGDHLDPLTLIPLYQANPQIHFICPKPAFTHLVSLGVDPNGLPFRRSVLCMNKTDWFITLFRLLIINLSAMRKMGLYLFWLVIKVALDGSIMLGYYSIRRMIEEVLRHTEKIDLACLPVNGRDGWRERMGMTGNLDGAEALELAQKLNAEVLFPMHNDLFKVNHVNPAILADCWIVERRGKKFTGCSREKNILLKIKRKRRFCVN